MPRFESVDGSEQDGRRRIQCTIEYKPTFCDRPAKVILYHPTIMLARGANHHIPQPNVMLFTRDASSDPYHQSKPNRPKAVLHLRGNRGRRVVAHLSCRETRNHHIM